MPHRLMALLSPFRPASLLVSVPHATVTKYSIPDTNSLLQIWGLILREGKGGEGGQIVVKEEEQQLESRILIVGVSV